ncbi:DUF5336 domain-containing protein [Streptomyces sp. A3M-1-3]|uniref:DUF5336 domain-containing protein n=1 Tax=Streptomyces sp. A3M-1-3 TaxID=2962044 RepID=UPI0020B8E8BA|nr:DUF5336 domain-containing protein [Streptomyces sp. A3M-1-3]MCP3816606.1 DUF5336 domain-containing protein [Streptomyces sp. A3M-1-3]
MNIRSLTRGDGVVIGAAVLLFIASFLNLQDFSAFGTEVTANAWEATSVLGSLFLAGIIGAALIVVARALPQPRKVAGLDLGQFGIAFAVFAAWSAFWTIVDLEEAAIGMILGLLAALVLAGAAVATPLVPALQAALIPAPKPQAPSPYGGQPGQPGPGQGYGYPGQGQPQPYGGQPGQPGQPGAGGPQQSFAGQPQPQAGHDPHPQQAAQPQPGPGGPAGDFAPFWFAVPVARPLYAEDGSPTPIAELAPGTWYLAVDQRGPGLVAQTQDGRRGVLQDTTGIQRG